MDSEVLWGEPLNMITCRLSVSLSLHLPQEGMGFDYIAREPLLPSPSAIFFVFECKCLVVSSSLLVNGHSAVHCELVFVRGAELKSSIEGLLLLVLRCLLSLSSVCAGPYPLDIRHADAVE